MHPIKLHCNTDKYIEWNFGKKTKRFMCTDSASLFLQYVTLVPSVRRSIIWKICHGHVKHYDEYLKSQNILVPLAMCSHQYRLCIAFVLTVCRQVRLSFKFSESALKVSLGKALAHNRLNWNWGERPKQINT